MRISDKAFDGESESFWKLETAIITDGQSVSFVELVIGFSADSNASPESFPFSRFFSC